MTTPFISRLPLVAALLIALLMTLLSASPAAAIFAPSPSVPTERLIKNLAAYLAEKPKDPEAHYLLARVHYMAFVNRVDQVRANDPGSATMLPKLVDPRQYGSADGEKIDEAAAIEHARSAIRSFRKAIELNEISALYHLGLAGIFEQAIPQAEKIGPPDTLKPVASDEPAANQPNVARLYAMAALQANLTAYKLDREAALAKDSIFQPFYPAAYEAGKAVQRLVKKYELKPGDEKMLDQIAADLKTMDEKPQAITPIVMRIEGATPRGLADLIAADATVRFDLDADGEAEPRAWVRPDTAILVWDPEHTGKIASGKQLFGNMTFFMLFSDGYRALDALDDNRDGQLAGDELSGLALWHDRNTNGISEPGEVTAVDESPIRSISAQTNGNDSGHPMNKIGITLDDDSTRPTWDWIIPGGTSSGE